MAQFDVHRYQGTRTVRYVVDVQSDLLEAFVTRLVIPVHPLNSHSHPFTRLNPEIEIEGRRHYLATQEMAAIGKSLLGAKVQSVAELRDAIVAAVDLLITGV